MSEDSKSENRAICVNLQSSGLTKNRENAWHVPLPEQKMFRDRTELTLFQAGTIPETVPVRSLF